MTQSVAAAAINTRTRIPRSRVLGLIIGVAGAAALVTLEWATVDNWDNVDPLLIFVGQSVAAVALVVPFRTRWIGVGLSVVCGLAWMLIGLFIWALNRFNSIF